MIGNFIIKFISLVVPIKILKKIEVIISGSLGKGVEFGVENEIQTIKKFLKKDPKVIFDIYRIGPSGPILIKEYTERDEIMIFANYLLVNKK